MSVSTANNEKLVKKSEEFLPFRKLSFQFNWDIKSMYVYYPSLYLQFLLWFFLQFVDAEHALNFKPYFLQLLQLFFKVSNRLLCL